MTSGLAGTGIIPWRKCRALIDTGADDIYFDSRVIKEIGVPETGERAKIKTIHSETEEKFYSIIIQFDGGPSATLSVLSADIDDGTRAYDAIFGYRFLELGTLTLNPNGNSCFEFRQNY